MLLLLLLLLPSCECGIIVSMPSGSMLDLKNRDIMCEIGLTAARLVVHGHARAGRHIKQQDRAAALRELPGLPRFHAHFVGRCHAVQLPDPLQLTLQRTDRGRLFTCKKLSKAADQGFKLRRRRHR